MVRPFELLENRTDRLLRLSYWRNVMPGLNQTRDIDIQVGECIPIPTDNSVDEFYILFEDYARCMKFRSDTAADGNWRWDSTDQFESTFDSDSKKISIVKKE
jgi:hypothetical protein